MATAAVKLEQGDAGVEATEVEEVGGEQAKGSNGSTEAPSKNAGRKRRRATLATLQTIYAAPGRFYLNNPRAQEQLETLVIAHLSKLHDEGFTRATLCSAAKCELCQWNSAPLCSLCGLKFVRA